MTFATGRRWGIALVAVAACIISRATTTTDAAWIAGGVSVLAPTAVQALTASKLDVTVEVYRETITLGWQSEDGRYWLTQKGRPPYQLGRSLALQNRRILLQDPLNSPSAASMSTAAASLRTADERIEESRGGLARFMTFLQSGPMDPARRSIYDDARKRAEPLKQLHEAIGDFRKTLGDALVDGTFSDEEAMKAATALRGIRLFAERFPSDISPETLDYFTMAFRGELLGLIAEGAASEEKPQDKYLTEAQIRSVTDDTTKAESSNKARLQQIAWKAVAIVREMLAEGKVVDEQKKVRKIDGTKIKAHVFNLIQAAGFLGGSVAELFGVAPGSEYNLQWEQTFIFKIVDQAVETAHVATYAGVTVSANFGPIANEVIQGVLAENDFIDQITSNPKRWIEFNYARSKGGPGTHNAIVYFENMLTPVLKSATFDPSQLLLANAQIYKRATGVLAQIYGAPTAADVAGADQESLNLINLEARKRTASEAEAKKRREMYEVLRQAADEYEALAAVKAAAGDAWKDNAAAKAHLEKLSSRLAALATKLDLP